MIIDGIIALLNGDTGVNALTAGRIYKSALPRGYTLPAIAVHRYGGAQDYDLSGPVGVKEDQIQLDVYGQDPDSASAAAVLVKALLEPYTGTLSDGTIVQACYLERDMDMPFLPHADAKGIADRSLLGFRVISTRV